jgi:hypothetical protein
VLVLDREFWMGVRRALLELVDVIERALGIEPRTAELRSQAKCNH